MDPASFTIAVKSCTPSLPSLNRTRRRKPPSLSSRVTLVNIETCDPFRLLACTRAPPILAQLALPGQRPFLHEACGCSRQLPIDHLTRFDSDERFVFAIYRMKMRRRMISNVHANSDAVKISDRRHRRRLNYPKSSAVSDSGSDA